jgi:hypothetical protein
MIEMPDPVGRTYKIVAFRIDLLPDKISKNIGSLNGLAAHYGLALVDDTGKVYHEVNGLAVGADGKPKPVGYLPSDRLYAWEDARPTPTTQFSLYSPSLQSFTLAQGNKA